MLQVSGGWAVPIRAIGGGTKAGATINREEAQAILNAKLDEYRRLAYADLAAKVGCEEICEMAGPSGTTYQMEILIAWDGRPDGDIRVLGSIDDGSFRSAFKPLCSDLVITPDGQEK